MKKIVSVILTIMLLLAFSGCEYYEPMRKVTGMTYENEMFNGAQNHESYNGLRAHAANLKISYFENTDKNTFESNFKTIIGEGHDFIWCVENGGKDIMLKEGVNHPDVLFAILDTYIENIPSNFITISFREHEGGFLAGYVAAKSTTAGKVGFLGGKEDEILKKYESGFIAGVNYAAKLSGTSVLTESIYTGNDHDTSIAKEAALNLYNEKGCDIVFHALQAGAYGAIEGAVEAGKLIICSGTDQSTNAADNVLISIIKNTKIAVSNTISKYIEREPISGINYVFGVKDRLISLSRNNKLLDRKLFNEANDIRNKIAAEEIKVPQNAEELAIFLNDLQNQ